MSKILKTWAQVKSFTMRTEPGRVQTDLPGSVEVQRRIILLIGITVLLWAIGARLQASPPVEKENNHHRQSPPSSVHSIESNKKIQEMEAAFNTAKKELEQQKHASERELKETKIWGLRIFITFIIIPILLLISAYRKIKASNQLLSSQKMEIQQQADELKNMNEKLMELSRFKLEMTGMIVHDLKNYLNAVIYYSQESFEDSMEIINFSGRQMMNEVTNILDVYKFEEAAVNLHKTVQPLSRTTNRAYKQIRFLTEAKSINVSDHTPPELEAEYDQDIIEQVIVNLMTNAVKYTNEKGRIKISAQTTPTGSVQVTVSDNGSGIPKNKCAVIFDRFQQVEARKSGEAKSTGLGLTYCKLAIEAHGGTITADSDVDKGSVFHFTLPSRQT